MTPDDALAFLVSVLRSDQQVARYGYDVYLDHVMWAWVRTHNPRIRETELEDRRIQHYRELSPAFFAAAWELCRRGVLRPGVRDAGEQGNQQGADGMGYSITPFGEMWLANAAADVLAVVIPARFVNLLSAHASRFGPGYFDRGREAVSCYSAHAFLACCVMCGAAAESILLALAIERKPEAEVLTMYSGFGGRARVEKFLVGREADATKREFSGFMMLLKYWRDDAAHGRPSKLSETEAFTSLMLLLRLARYADEVFPERA